MSTSQPTGLQALHLLQSGNERFRNGLRSIDALASNKKMQELAEKGQSPFAIILTCSDSRVPAETVFDQGLGDLFVIRVAGNVVAPSLIASIEFAASKFQTPLCVVMGHTACGAIDSTITVEQENVQIPSPNLSALVEMIRPVVKSTMQKNPGITRDKLLPLATLHNVRQSVDQLLERSEVIRQLSASGKLMITGAVYDIRTGKVDFEDVAHMAIQEDGRTVATTGRTENGVHATFAHK